MIVENQTQYGWGKSIVENLSTDLKKEFPGNSGFSVQNLWYMRQFYIEYKDATILKRDLTFYTLVLAIAISLLLTGAGAFAFDIPL